MFIVRGRTAKFTKGSLVHLAAEIGTGERPTITNCGCRLIYADICSGPYGWDLNYYTKCARCGSEEDFKSADQERIERVRSAEERKNAALTEAKVKSQAKHNLLETEVWPEVQIALLDLGWQSTDIKSVSPREEFWELEKGGFTFRLKIRKPSCVFGTQMNGSFNISETKD